MRRDDQRPIRPDGVNRHLTRSGGADQHDAGLHPERKTRHEEGTAWAITPETRAREGVQAGFQESTQAMRGSEEAPSVNAGAPPSSYADSSSVACRPADRYSAPIAQPQGYSADASPSPAPMHAQTPAPAPSYDPYRNDRYDVYQHHQYDDYYLHDDYYLGEDYYYNNAYYRDEYLPHEYHSHLYYDTGTYPDPQSSIPATSYYSEQARGYSAPSYRHQETRRSDDSRGAEPFASSAATAAGLILTEEHIAEAQAAAVEPLATVSSYAQEASSALNEPASQASNALAQTACAQSSVIAERPSICPQNDGALHQLQSQPLASTSLEHSTMPETPRAAAATLTEVPLSPIQDKEQAMRGLTVNPRNEARGAESHSANGLVPNPDARSGQSREFLVTPSNSVAPADTRNPLLGDSSAATLVSSRSEALGSRFEPFRTRGFEPEESATTGFEARHRQTKGSDDPNPATAVATNPSSKDAVPANKVSDAISGASPKDDVITNATSETTASTPSKEAVLANAGNEGAHAFGSTTHIAALGTLGFAGKVAKTGAKHTLGALDYAANQMLRQDEDLTRVAELDDIVHDGVSFMRRHAPASHSDSVIERLISSERSVEDAIAESGVDHAAEHVEVFGRTRSDAGKTATGRHARKPTEAVLKVKEAGIREIPEAANAGELFAAAKSSDIVSSKADLLEKGPTDLKAVAAKAGERQGVESLLTGGENSRQTGRAEGKDVPNKKKPATERERDVEKKKAARKAAKKEKNDSKAMSVVKHGGRAGMKGALLIGGMAVSSTKKALASRNEEVAVAMSTVDKTKKTAKGAKTLVKLPFRICHYTKQAVMAAVNAVKHLFSFAATLTSMGPVGAVIALALFFLVIVVIVILFATASIINDEQEVSEVSALVAELDAELTEEIREMGDQPILYLDASETYNQKGSENQSLTKNADLADDESDLQEVVASSVTVQTDPGAIAAYIDAKYTGNWQVGAASWKYTIDAFGETWNVIEWDDMPEWAWKGLNKVNRVDFKVTLSNELTDLLMEDFGVEEPIAREIGNDTAEEFATVIYDNQIQGINEEILMQIIKDSVKAHKSDLDLTSDETRKLYYQMQNVIADLIGEEDPFAFVYDEIVGLHAQMNWWSDRYDAFTDLITILAGPNIPVGSGSGTDNKYGYPNSTGYDEEELANWDGFNEVSVYGISEAGTGAVTADGTRITNTWNDANMGIACEGLQNSVFAYWSSDYKAATGVSDGEPVKITLYNPLTGKSVTAQVIDCGGWRGYNANYAGMNADRQWDLLPAVWKALGGSEQAGTMKVYWKVDPEAVVGEPALKKKSIEGYLWPKETDEGDDVITVTRPTLIVHDIQDALNNDTLMEKIIDRESFATDAEFEAVKTFVITKVKDVMKTLLTMENSEGETYVDYNYVRRYLGDPFGDNDQGNPREWVITHRFNPGYEDFDDEKAYVDIKPLDNMRTVRAVLEGEVEEIDDGVVTIRSYIDTANSSEVVYSELTDIRVEEGDEVREGQKIGAMADETLRVSYYEINDTALLLETKKDWAYDPGLYMIGFAGYEEPAEPVEYVGPTSDYSGCQTVVEFAYSRLGCPYVWGATGPNTFDCSGLTQWCYAQAGISIPRNSEAQHDAAAAAGNLVSLANLQPGDILWRPGHVGIYVGDGKYVHAPHTGDVVKVSGDIFSFQCGLSF